MMLNFLSRPLDKVWQCRCWICSANFCIWLNKCNVLRSTRMCENSSSCITHPCQYLPYECVAWSHILGFSLECVLNTTGHTVQSAFYKYFTNFINTSMLTNPEISLINGFHESGWQNSLSLPRKQWDMFVG